MDHELVPHTHNSAGHRRITLGVKRFKCMGAKPPFDHPHIYIDMGSSDEAICPYCSTHYAYSLTLDASQSIPEDCLLSEH